MITTLLLATQNQGKLKEMQALLQESRVKVISPAETSLPPDFDVEEIGESFQEISLKKAKEYAEASGYACLADDSGLVVDALDGKPGIHSKRFIDGSDLDRNNKILELMEGKTDRRAKFVSVLCLYDPQEKKPHFFEGEVVGQIAQEMTGSTGFGYDPIFIPEGHTQSFAELGAEVKNTISHRARALQKVQQFFAQQSGKEQT